MFTHRTICGCLLVLLILSPFGEPQAASAPAVPQIGDPLAHIQLPLPESLEQRNYLGIPAAATGTFALQELRADLVVVEIFSMYCPHCQREAPRVNELFALLQKRAATAPRIRLLGIGVGNSPMEVEVFRKTYAIAFPLFSDGNFTIHKQLGEVRTPFFFAFRPGETHPAMLNLTQLGPFESVATFAERLSALAKEKGP